MKRLKVQDMVIITDSREQCPWLFTSIIPPPKIIIQGLKTGDYSIQGGENSGIVVERKSIPDLFGSVGKGRNRLKSEFQRMAEYQYAAIILERSFASIIKNPPENTQMLPKAVFQTLISWSIKYGVHVWPAEDRIMAEKICYSLFSKFWKYQLERI